MLENKPLDHIISGKKLNPLWSRWLDLLQEQANYGTAPNRNTQVLESTSQIVVDSTLMRIEGSVVGTTTLTSDPQIYAGESVRDGQSIMLEGSNADNLIEIVDGNGLDLENGDSFEMGEGDTISLHYTLSRDIWVEDNRSKK